MHSWLKCTLIFLYDNIWKSIVPETSCTSKIGLLWRLRWVDVQNHCCNLPTIGLSCTCWRGQWPWCFACSACAARPRGPCVQLIVNVLRGPVASVFSLNWMCWAHSACFEESSGLSHHHTVDVPRAPGVWRTLAVLGLKHWPAYNLALRVTY